ncbi:hypothetical protein MNBD_PLANCTO03-1863 [hydrothermal vent metagenome]|uniref:DNA-directed RNA polymerase n=1 Tax=hydrothermal vent metagenome TaxID=652676 RepID=A0A3B1DMF7_9ZZZZ
MLEALKSDELHTKVGGKFKLCTLIQRRLGQLMDGARPLIERDGRSDLELVMEEILQDKITLSWVGDETDGGAESGAEPLAAGADEPLL